MNVSVVIPLRDEGENVDRLLDEIPESLGRNPHVDDFELLCIDDGSRDDTRSRLHARPAAWLRILVLDGPQGKETALATGIDEARFDVLALMDGDHQTSPDDMEPLLAALDDGYDLVTGTRTSRRDGWVKRMSSSVARRIRSAVLGDDYRDINCPMKVGRRSCFQAMPRFPAWHRYMPVLASLGGGRVHVIPIRHFPRAAGRSKYGINNRLWIGLRSLLHVRRLVRDGIDSSLENDDGPT